MKNASKKMWFVALGLLLLNTLNAQTFTQLQQACNNDGIVMLNIGNGYTPPFVYTWYDNGILVKTDTSNATTDTLFNYSGNYAFCNFTSLGMTTYAGTFYSPPFSYSVSLSDPMCPATLGSGTVSVTGGQSPFTIQWTNHNSGQVTMGSPAVLSAGSYSVHVVDANGCVLDESDSIAIYQLSPVNVTLDTVPAGCTNGAVSIQTTTGGIAPYTYLWSNGQTSPQINNLITGYYNVTVTDAQGCSTQQYAFVRQTVNINANVVPTAATCLQNDGSAITFGSGGVPPYAYLYSNGQTTQTANGLLNGGYNVQVTDANNCIASNWFYINSSTPITVTYTASASSCTAPTGSATLTISGGQPPYTVNWSTVPVQTAAVLNGVDPGLYTFTVTDANGCVNSGSVYVPSVSNLWAGISASNATCPASNGAASVNAMSASMPITFLWNTGATTPSISGLTVGNYNCTITDAAGCQLHKTVSVLSSSPMALGFLATPSTCIFRNDGAINLSVAGGTPPYTYSWSNGQSTQNAANLVGNKNYWVTVTDNSGCQQASNVYLGYDASNDSCYCTVTGTVYYDANGNCVKDLGETPVQNILINNNNTITAYSISNYMFTDPSGNYSFMLPSGNYNLQEVVQYLYPLSSCQSNTNPLALTASSGCTYTVDFANGINPLHDVHVINTHLTMPVPGNNYVQQVIVQNDGTVTENNVQLGYVHDGQLGYVNSSGISLTQPNTGLAPYWYNNTAISLSPGSAASTLITYAVPTNIPLGTVVNFWDSTAYQAPMSNWLNDYSPWNNVKAFDTIVVGSFDPNVKEVYPKGIGPLGYITSADTVLDYVIHFQNTGSWPAAKVVVVDTLDPDLDWQSLKPGFSNFAYTASLDMNGVVSFAFNNINLPTASTFSLGSIGTITYSIHTKKNLAQGTQFRNSAAIYFDYNAPVMTNTTINTINNSIGVQQVVKSKDGLMSLFPNPAAESCTVKIASEDAGAGKINLYSMDGSLVSSQDVNLIKGDNHFQLQVSSLAGGLYIVRTTYNDKMHSCKLSVVR